MIDVEKLRKTAAKSTAKELRKQRKLRRENIKKYLREIEKIIKEKSRKGRYRCSVCFRFEFEIFAIRLFRLKNKNINVSIHFTETGKPWAAEFAWGEDVACDDKKQNK